MDIIKNPNYKNEIPNVIYSQSGDFFVANAFNIISTSTSSSLLTVNTIIYIPIWFPNNTNVNQLTYEVTSAVGTSINFGFYNSFNNLPRNLITKLDNIPNTLGYQNLPITGIYSGLHYGALLLNSGSIPGVRSCSVLGDASKKIGISSIGTNFASGFRVTSQTTLPNIAIQENPINRFVNNNSILIWYRVG